MRRKNLGSLPKIIQVAFREENTSPYVLNLREKLNPPPFESAWQPSPLDKMLSAPVEHFKETVKPDKEKWRVHWSELRERWPRFDWRPRVRLPKIRLPNFKFLTRAPRAKKIESRGRVLIIEKPSVLLPGQLRRAALAFAVVSLFFVLPLKVFSAYYTLKDTQASLVEVGGAAFARLEKGRVALEAWDLAAATREIQSALEFFTQAQNEISQINPVWRGLVGAAPVAGSKFRNGEHLMMAGNNLALAALPVLDLLEKGDGAAVGGQVAALGATFAQVLPRVESASRHLMAVEPDSLPEENRGEFLRIREAVGSLDDVFKKARKLVDSLSLILGKDETKNYLLIFQNNNELRPTGGFIGSFAELRVKNGEIVKLNLPGEGSYQLQGSLKVALVPPTPLQLLVSKWEFQDANWFPDFPTSARKLIWFYEKSGGPTVDGVIALDTQVMLDLLKITGPIDLPAYGKTITADNFIYEIQKQVEIDYDKTVNKPKQILADLVEPLSNAFLKNKKNLLPALLSANRGLNERHIQIYATEPFSEGEMISQGWGGELKSNPEGDYLAVINANIAGGKTDGVIKQDIEHQTKIQEDGSVINTVRVTREHRGAAGDIFTDLQNVSYIRFYVPEGSELLLTDGFGWPDEDLFKVPNEKYVADGDLEKIEETQKIDSRDGTVITQEFGKTVFGNWVMTKRGQASAVTIVYRLPYKVLRPPPPSWRDLFDFGNGSIFPSAKNYAAYSLLTQKQAGRLDDGFEKTIAWPASWQLVWADPRDVGSESGQAIWTADLAEDRFMGMLWEYK